VESVKVTPLVGDTALRTAATLMAARTLGSAASAIDAREARENTRAQGTQMMRIGLTRGSTRSKMHVVVALCSTFYWLMAWHLWPPPRIPREANTVTLVYPGYAHAFRCVMLVLHLKRPLRLCTARGAELCTGCAQPI
jgi:hypothetical protein